MRDTIILLMIVFFSVYLFFVIRGKVLICSGADFVIKVRYLVKKYKAIDNINREISYKKKKEFYDEVTKNVEELSAFYESLEKYEFDYAEEDWNFILTYGRRLEEIKYDVRYQKWLNSIY